MNGTVKCAECGGNKCQKVSDNKYRCLYCGSTFVSHADPVPPAAERAVPPPQVVYIERPSQTPSYQAPIRKSDKSRSVALLLAFFFGGLGIDWFYLGKTTAGVLCVLFCWTGIPLIVGLIHCIVLLFTSDEQFDRQYNYW